VWLAVGVQEQVPADRAAALLFVQQDQGAAIGWGCVFVAPLGPVVGVGGVIGRRLAVDQLVSDDLGSGEFG
jgi:hypothetical protein